MIMGNRFRPEDLPDLPHARQLKEGFPWLKFHGDLECQYRRTILEEHFGHIRINLVLAITVIVAFAAIETVVLGPDLDRIPGLLHMLMMVPLLLLCIAATFSARRDRLYPPLAFGVAALLGLSVVAIHVFTSLAGVPILFPGVELTVIFIYFMGGLRFHHALAANLILAFAFLAAGTALPLPGREFGYDALAILALNLFCASVSYMHEKTSRMRFLEDALLSEMVARDGLTGIHNRRMFDQHMERAWHQAVRARLSVAVALIDIDCFKDYNDRYGHQAGDECLRAVAVSLSQCARRPMDFVARYGGEEFAIVLYEASREYVAEVLTRIQRTIAELNIAHDASRVARRLTVSIGAAYVMPGALRTPEGLIQLADEALYSAKEQGRNRVVVMETEYEDMRTGRFEKRRAVP